MPRSGLKKWSDIADRYTQALLLGNGASIAFSETFRYQNLFAYARQHNLITPEIAALFEHFDTTDFELVLRLVWLAHELNHLLGIQEPNTEAAYDALRASLIQVVQSVHPTYAETAPKLAGFGGVLRHFDTIVSLNYDLLVYWALMYSNDTVPAAVFKDCFVGGVFRRDWQSLREPMPGTKKAILVFYPHGNLALAVSPDGVERKIGIKDSVDLLTQIADRWKIDRWHPLFVSEGTSKDKLVSINGSTYPAIVLREVLPSLGVSLAVFGWSFAPGDDHILSQLLQGKLTRMAVSVHTGNPNWRDLRDDLRRKIKKATRPSNRPTIEFFDADTMPVAAPNLAPAKVAQTTAI